MHSLRGWNWLVLGNVVGLVHGAAVPVITPAPRPDVRSLQHRQDPDAIEILQVLITALPLSLRQMAATNIPAVSSILWEEFLDDNRPQWFEELPYDIQSYFIQEFGPATAAPPASEALPTDVTVSPTALPSETASNVDSSIFDAILCDIRIRKFEHDFYAYGIFEQFFKRNYQRGIFLWIFFRIFDHTSDLIIIVIVIAIVIFGNYHPVAPASSDAGLTRREKIGLGVGVPLAVLAIAALLLACCLILRRKRRRSIEGSQPPSSPGFIPRFSFQDRGLGGENFEHRRPLNPASHQTSRFVEDMNWEDDGYDPAPMSTAYHGHQIPPAAAPTPSQANNIATAGIPHPNDGNSMPSESTPMAMQDNHTPILAPALYHSHSSNRARGRRTSYKSLHSVAEVTEPDEELNGDSPVLGRNNSPPKTGPRRPSMSALDTLPVPAVASIKRKPVPTSPISSLAAEASRGLLRPSLAYNSADHSGSSSSGLAVSSLSSNSGHGYQSDDSGPISPITHQQPSSNPFAGGYAYLEDYGPEYSNNGYTDQDDELYGGHRSFDRYPDPSSSLKKSSKTEWPLRNVMGGGQKRTRSPMWDRVYERV
ncbi:hypothetical protein J4E83_003913 [Alternaria metachromatica]|uniref:uncharacterized protein n=1 Tax=Alternaria metachromatica TaxID=283354 RepID=UPI0020C246AD|nr:uncharacterized protein J4E83_003913 [Alternaria metachromatica]KAI4626761.1 hypothetical protein J4E83_003913 [Alternaria metachromatica]